jgi:hypothetical protein
MFNSSADTFINWSFSDGHFHKVVILSNGHFWRSEQFKKRVNEQLITVQVGEASCLKKQL